MFEAKVRSHFASQLAEIACQGLWKEERVIESPQAALIRSGGRDVLNLCANNYLGLSNHPALAEAAAEALRSRGYGMSSVRFICGTLDLHKELERRMATFLGMEDAILYSSCFDANGGLFETLLGQDDAVISDELNHASIIDGVRLCKAQRYRYRNSDMEDLRARLTEARAAGADKIMIATDGVFSMDGYIARLDAICDLAEEFGAMVMVDDSHASGFVGPTGRGTPEYRGVMGRIDIVTTTFGKALGGASGGVTAGRSEIVAYLRQRSRPYLFSNSVMPAIAAATIRALDLVEQQTDLLVRLKENMERFRAGIAAAGLETLPGEHPIIPVMLYDARLAQDFARDMLAEGVYVIGFSYPVVPKGRARIRTQMSAAHTLEQLDRAVEAFARVARRHGCAK